MRKTSEEDMRRVFDSLNAPGRPIRAIADAYGRGDTPLVREEYDSEKVRAVNDRLLSESVGLAGRIVRTLSSGE